MKQAILIILFVFSLSLLHSQVNHRLIVLADMGNEPDEVQQMFHLLMYADRVDIEGLVAVSGIFLHPNEAKPERRRLYPELFHDLINGYEKVHPNLLLHTSGWPTTAYLRSIVASGQSGYGAGDIGEGKSSAGSQLIINAATKPDHRPLHIVVNAGSNTLAQALVDYRATHTTDELKAFVAKLIVYENQAQDDAGAWICHEFPDIHWIRSRHQTRCYGGTSNNILGPHVWQPYEYSPKGQDEWAQENVRNNHGAFGALYPGRLMNDKFHFIEGGGTIPWMRLVLPGLANPAEPSWGGWSGRYTRVKVANVPSPYPVIAAQETKSMPFAMYTDFEGVTDRWVDPQDGKVYDDQFTPVWRWRAAMWNDFKARMDWCVKPFKEANHYPVAVVNGDKSNSILRITALTGATHTFNASKSTDPDGDKLTFKWWVYDEAGTYVGQVKISDSNKSKISVSIPTDAANKQIQLILEVKDDNKIASLITYRRIVIDVVDSTKK